MKVLDPGHDYLLTNLSKGKDIVVKHQTRLTFVKRIGEMYPGNKSSYEGTNMQEVIRALIDRCEYVYRQIPSERTGQTVTYLRHAMFELEKRAAERHGRELDFNYIWGIECRPTCKKCGHIGCRGECHD